MGTPRRAASAFSSASLCEATRLEVAASTVKSFEQTATDRPSTVPKPATFESAGVALVHPRHVGGVEGAELDERARVEQARDPPSRVELALRPAARETLGASHPACALEARVEIFHPLVPCHGPRLPRTLVAGLVSYAARS